MRDITQLHPELQQKSQQLKETCASQGLQIAFSECLRSTAEQDALYEKGRTAPGKIVTNAKGSTYSSMHQWGVAIDFYRNDGTGAYNDNDGFFTKVGRIGQSIGLEWGGDWKSIKDKPHFQLPQWGSTPSKLKEQYGTPGTFMAIWGSVVTPQQSSEVMQQSQTEQSPIVNLHLRDLQGALNADGITDSNGNKLKEDGIWGPKTASAIWKFTLSTLSSGHWKYCNTVAWCQCRLESATQINLKDKHGNWDGKYGNDSTRACNDYRAYKGLPQTGVLDASVVNCLLNDFGVNC